MQRPEDQTVLLPCVVDDILIRCHPLIAVILIEQVRPERMIINEEQKRCEKKKNTDKTEKPFSLDQKKAQENCEKKENGSRQKKRIELKGIAVLNQRKGCQVFGLVQAKNQKGFIQVMRRQGFLVEISCPIVKGDDFSTSDKNQAWKFFLCSLDLDLL